jgi:hypothetical protein
MKISHQRKNAVSNTQVGIDFEDQCFAFFQKRFPALKKPFNLSIGHIEKKSHKFDMGCSVKKVIIECKSHTWTEGGNVPSAKITTWDQAMLYFFLAPRSYRKIFVVKYDLNPNTGKSLCSYYLRTHPHVIPDEVEFWELDETTGKFRENQFDVTGSFTGDLNVE